MQKNDIALTKIPFFPKGFLLKLSDFKTHFDFFPPFFRLPHIAAANRSIPKAPMWFTANDKYRKVALWRNGRPNKAAPSSLKPL